jgi:UDP-3-O-[3-hydroxymyristoyl] glucosamine N-acyltransferase
VTALRLADLAALLHGSLRGEAHRTVHALAALDAAEPDQLTFYADPARRPQLLRTRAAAVLLAPAHAPDCPVDCIVVASPYLAFARLSALFDDAPAPAIGIHPSAVIAPGVRIGEGVSIGAHCSVEEGVELGAHCVLGAGCSLGRGARIGEHTRLWPRVTVYHGVRIGARVRIHAGSVIGADGFGFADSADGWVRIAQTGGVVIDDEVEIGACSTVDRGTLGDTVIGRGVKMDNQVHIAHNVRIGEHTAIAGCTGIAGSVRIGARCRIGGGVGIVDGVTIADGVSVTAMSLVSRSIAAPGSYSAGTLLQPSAHWRRTALRTADIERLHRRLTELERRLAGNQDTHEGDDSC